jgi:hypothetical protein
MSRRLKLSILGVVLVLWGGLWFLQGLDVLGQDGGMNGNGNFTVIGGVVLVIGLGIVVLANRSRSAPR